VYVCFFSMYLESCYLVKLTDALPDEEDCSLFPSAFDKLSKPPLER